MEKEGGPPTSPTRSAPTHGCATWKAVYTFQSTLLLPPTQILSPSS